jgi:hypothetical protein
LKNEKCVNREDNSTVEMFTSEIEGVPIDELNRIVKGNG